MALDHLHSSQAVALGTGPRASKKLSYIRRSGEYSHKPDASKVVAWEGNVPPPFDDIDDFLLHAEFHERKNGTIYREVEFALPIELNREQRIQLAKDIVNRFTDRCLDDNKTQILTPYAAAIHNLEGDNPHVHLVRAERHVQLQVNYQYPDKAGFFKRQNKKAPEKGGLLKLENTAKFRKEALEWERRHFETYTNEHLESAGFDERVDMRSYKDRGIDLVPQVHESPKTRAVFKRTGVKSERMKYNELVRERNEYAIQLKFLKDHYDSMIDYWGVHEAIGDIRESFDRFLASAPDELKKTLRSDFEAKYGMFEERKPFKPKDRSNDPSL